jgi:hypothetical protein
VTGVRQRVATGMTEHVRVYPKGQAGFLPGTLDQPVRRAPIEHRKLKLSRLVRTPHPGIVLNDTAVSTQEDRAFGAIRNEPGNLRLRKTAWWGWEDSNFQPNDY